ncbi:hypothetical protein [Alkalibacterium sp. 20]|uniref:hypothetical protein n=1 Tax=Alkalibacterium sp. 20 TaxID=1798803 RepID=UPI00090013D7|nr:hypothetical protein [Alkalibacterium sp. 20]OJF94690.1 hypothetical protein AX762_07365 [Alkalibacterium sp. 20]
MNEQLIETIKQLEIKKAPEEQSLEAANQTYTKKQLAHFIERHELPIAKSWKKDEIVSSLTEWMKEARINLLTSDAELRSFYSYNVKSAEQPLDIYDANLSETDLERVLLLIEHGLIFNIDGELWVPDETIKVVTDDVESPELTSTEKEAVPEEKAEETKTQSESLQQKRTQSHPRGQRTQTTASSVSTEEELARNKKTRLKYLKTQAKKNKRKKK